jgi:anti-sigma-K factor RskA
MNTQEYIESGILEQYVMGTLSAQEKQEVECMSHIYPEIAAELLSIQTTMEAFATSNQKTPPSHLRDQILGSLHELAISEKNAEGTAIDTPVESVTTNTSAEPVRKDNIVAMRFNVMRIAASVLLLVSLGLAYLLFQNRKVQNEQASEIASIKNDLQNKSQTIALQNTELQVIQNPDFKKVNLAGIPAKSPDAQVTVYWNKQSNDVYLRVGKLPEPPTDKQYQLWAIADGKPVDMGMLSEINLDTLFQKMKTIENASAFAITLEKKGGVASPTLTEMYVMGGV